MYKFKLNDPHFLPHAGANIEFELSPASILVITGNNGVGKSTLMRRFYNRFNLNSILIGQTPSDLFYDRSLRKVKDIFLETRSNAIDIKLFHDLWNEFGLIAKEERTQSNLSGGEGQLLKLILGLTIKSEVYLLDEPSHYLDSKMKEKLNKVIADKVQEGSTFIIIEHDLTWMTFPYQGILIQDNNEQVEVAKIWNT